MFISKQYIRSVSHNQPGKCRLCISKVNGPIERKQILLDGNISKTTEYWFPTGVRLVLDGADKVMLRRHHIRLEGREERLCRSHSDLLTSIANFSFSDDRVN